MLCDFRVWEHPDGGLLVTSSSPYVVARISTFPNVADVTRAFTTIKEAIIDGYKHQRSEARRAARGRRSGLFGGPSPKAIFHELTLDDLMNGRDGRLVTVSEDGEAV
jgi:hypothetical protein